MRGKNQANWTLLSYLDPSAQGFVRASPSKNPACVEWRSGGPKALSEVLYTNFGCPSITPAGGCRADSSTRLWHHHRNSYRWRREEALVTCCSRSSGSPATCAARRFCRAARGPPWSRPVRSFRRHAYPIADLASDLFCIAAPMHLRRRGVDAASVMGTAARTANPVPATHSRRGALLGHRLACSDPAVEKRKDRRHHGSLTGTQAALTFLFPKLHIAIATGTLQPELTLIQMLRAKIRAYIG